MVFQFHYYLSLSYWYWQRGLNPHATYYPFYCV
nr:MAG TPA: hypothetical protein [Crassvirales sp.]